VVFGQILFLSSFPIAAWLSFRHISTKINWLAKILP